MISLEKFKSDIGSRSTTKSSRFIVEIFPPSILSEIDTSQLTFRCDSSELPGRSITSTEHRTVGPARKRPNQSGYADLNITLICSASFQEKKFFDQWQNQIQSTEDFKFGYYDEYISTLHVTQLNDELQPIYKIEVLECWPMVVAPMPLNWETTNDLQKVQITFAYRKWDEMETTLFGVSAPGEKFKEEINKRVSSSLSRITSSKININKFIKL